MSPSFSASLLVLIAFGAANLPFLTQRRWLFQDSAVQKSLGFRLLEVLCLYVLVGLLGLAMENSDGQVARQGWEFYAITGTLFLTFSFPGFCYRYLFKRRN